MFSLSIENKQLKQAVQQVLTIVFGKDVANGTDSSIIIADDSGIIGTAVSEGQAIFCFVPRSVTSSFSNQYNAEIIEYPLAPTDFLRKLELGLNKVAVPDFDKIIKIQGFKFKPYEFLLVSDDNKKIILTEKERNILLLLHKFGKTPVSKEVMLKEIWQYAPNVETHTLETHIYRLRQKIEEDPTDPQILITEENGYRILV